MGLDVFAARSPEESLTEEDVRAFDEAGIKLCGGIISSGAGSFRGKVYDTLILDITGVNLYQDWIPPDVVLMIHADFLRCKPIALMGTYEEMYANLDQEYRGDSLEELTEKILELRKFFGVCAERGLGLVGYY